MCIHRFVYPEDKPENVNPDDTLTGTCKLCGLKNKSYGRRWVTKRIDDFYYQEPYGETTCEKVNLSDN